MEGRWNRSKCFASDGRVLHFAKERGGVGDDFSLCKAVKK